MVMTAGIRIRWVRQKGLLVYVRDKIIQIVVRRIIGVLKTLTQLIGLLCTNFFLRWPGYVKYVFWKCRDILESMIMDNLFVNYLVITDRLKLHKDLR